MADLIRPTPTQEENDSAAMGLSSVVHVPDGSGDVQLPPIPPQPEVDPESKPEPPPETIDLARMGLLTVTDPTAASKRTPAAAGNNRRQK